MADSFADLCIRNPFAMAMFNRILPGNPDLENERN